MLVADRSTPPPAPSTAAERGAAGWLGRRLSAYLARPSRAPSMVGPTPARTLRACLRPGDVLLVEGRTRLSTAIKYLTQSTWSHAALYVGAIPGADGDGGEPLCFVEADIRAGVRAVGMSEFDGLHCRVCRPVGLTAEDVARVVRFVVERIGHRYDLRNVIDLARYLLPAPPLPARWRRRMLTLGSGDPTRAICSTLIAQAFQSVRYPILHARHYSLCVPRDFDVSPYFEVVKPEIAAGVDPRRLEWAEPRAEAMPAFPMPIAA